MNDTFFRFVAWINVFRCSWGKVSCHQVTGWGPDINKSPAGKLCMFNKVGCYFDVSEEQLQLVISPMENKVVIRSLDKQACVVAAEKVKYLIKLDFEIGLLLLGAYAMDEILIVL